MEGLELLQLVGSLLLMRKESLLVLEDEIVLDVDLHDVKELVTDSSV